MTNRRTTPCPKCGHDVPIPASEAQKRASRKWERENRDLVNAKARERRRKRKEQEKGEGSS